MQLSDTEFEYAKRGVMKQNVYRGFGLVLFFGLGVLVAGAQNQASQNSAGSSLGDYARQIRKDPGVKSTPKVFDNDNLPREDKLSIVGPKPAPAEEKNAENKAADSAPAAEGEAKAQAESKPGAEATTAAAKAEEKTASTGSKAPVDEATKQAAAKQWNDKITAQRGEIELLTRELNVLQREYQIRAAAMYADAGNRLRNSADWDKQDAQYKQQIADKQKALDEAKQKLDDMQEQARRAGAPASVSEQ